MESESLVMTSLTTATSSDFSTRTSTPESSVDHDVGWSELQPQIRVLRRYRHYRAASASPPSAKRRAATVQNGTRRPSPATGGRVDVRPIVDVDCTTSTSVVRSLPATPLPPPKTCLSTINAVVVSAATTTTTTTTTTATTTTSTSVKFATASTTITTSKMNTTNKSSLLVVTQASNDARGSYSTFDGGLDVSLPLDGFQKSSYSGSDGRMNVKTRKFNNSGNALALDVDATAAEASRKRRWRVRRQAVVGTPLKDVTPATQEGEQRLNRARKCVNCLKGFVAFLFSTIGLTILLVGYTILGGIIFQFVEAPNEV